MSGTYHVRQQAPASGIMNEITGTCILSASVKVVFKAEIEN